MSHSQYTIHELSTLTDTRFWKLHWFEALTMNQQTREPLIEARFVPLMRTDLKIEDNPPELLDNSSYNFSHSKKIEVGGGQLPMLHIGLLLHHGRPVARPSYQRRIFDLFIDHRTTRVLPVNKSYKTGPHRWAYYIPFNEYYLHGTNLFTRCLHIDVSQKRSDGISKVIVPCAEVIRHHYGNSSELFREILTDGLAGKPNRVFNENKTIMPGASNVPFVQLSKYDKDEDAPIVARLAFSPYAFANAKHIYISAQNNFKRPHQGRVPEATLPYINQQTRLIVHGKTIRSGAERYFLVYYIEKDYAPFPFEYFEYDRDNSGTHVVEDKSLPVSGWQKQEQAEEIITVQSEIEKQIIRSDREPSPDKEQVEEILLADKFPDLKKKDWQKRQKPGSHSRAGDRQVGFIQGHDDTADLSTAPAGHGNTKVTSLSLLVDLHSGEGAEGAEPVPVTEAASDIEPPVTESTPQAPTPQQVNRHGKVLPALPASYDLFSDLVRRLNLVKPGELSCEIVELTESGPAIPHVALSSFPTTWKDDHLPWSKVFRGGERRARYVLAALGHCHRSHYFYLLEIEPPESEDENTYTMFVLHSDNERFPDLDGEDLQEVLAYCAMNRGSWLKDEELERFGRRKLKHASKVRRRYVFRIVEYLSQVGLLRIEKSELAALSKDSKLSKAGKLSSTGQLTERVEESGESLKDKESSQAVEDVRTSQAEELIVADEPTEVAVASGASESSESDEPNETDESEVLTEV